MKSAVHEAPRTPKYVAQVVLSGALFVSAVEKSSYPCFPIPDFQPTETSFPQRVCTSYQHGLGSVMSHGTTLSVRTWIGTYLVTAAELRILPPSFLIVGVCVHTRCTSQT